MSQVDRVSAYCAAKGWVVSRVVTDLGSGLNDSRRGLLSLLQDHTVARIVVEHKDRLYDMSSGSFIKHCVSVLAASEFTGVDRGRVAKCCFGESSFCGNFKFSFSYASTGN